MEAIRRLIFDYIINATWYSWREVGMVFFTSMIPVFELRAAIALGPDSNMPWIVTYLAAVCGNLLPVPFIILFVRRIFALMRRYQIFVGVVDRLEHKAEANKEKVLKYAKWGLFLFVAVPLPGTGAWTGSLVAAMLDIRLKSAFPVIAAGVATAGIIMTVFYYTIARIFPQINFTLIIAVVVVLVVGFLLVARMVKKRKNQ